MKNEEENMNETTLNVIELKIIEGSGAAPPSGAGAGSAGDGPAPVFASADALATRLVTQLGDDWRFAAGNWYCWDGRRWEREQTKLAWDRSRQVAVMSPPRSTTTTWRARCHRVRRSMPPSRSPRLIGRLQW